MAQSLGSGKKLIAIDGFMSSGKTTLAIQVAEELSGIRVGLDCYVESEREASDYVGLLRLTDLAEDLNKLRAAFDYVVIDGICMLEALESISVSPDLYVYVKRISQMGLWQDGFHLEDYESTGEECNFARQSELEYHASRRPHELAAIVYHRRPEA